MEQPITIIKRKAPAPPKELLAPGKGLWASIQGDGIISDADGLAKLTSACRIEDDIWRMRSTVAREGDQIADRHGQLRPHPLLGRICSLELIKLKYLGALHLEDEPPKPIGRPPYSPSRNRP